MIKSRTCRRRQVYVRPAGPPSFFILLGRRTFARDVGAAAGMGAGVIRCGPFCGAVAIGRKEIQKPLVFGGVLFHISFAVERNMAAGGNHAGRGYNPQSGKRAVGDAGPYGGSDESAPVFKGAPMRAVGDAGPYGVRERGREETTRARGAEYLFYILPQKHKRLQRKVSFSHRGSLYLDTRRVSAPLPAACYQLSCVLYWATIRRIAIWKGVHHGD